MLEPGREPRTGRSRYPSTQRNPQRGCYLALTFGTLLSSQGADARDSRPVGLRSRRLFHVTPLAVSVKRRVHDPRPALGAAAPGATDVPPGVFPEPPRAPGRGRPGPPAGGEVVPPPPRSPPGAREN